MTGRGALGLLAALAGFAAGVGAVLTFPLGDKPAALTCRPSAPARLPAGPSVLILGNSLAFDADWPLARAQAINCARQGLTAAEALPLVETLPTIAPEAVLLVFGTVELVRGTADPEAFQVDMTALVQALRTRAPGATVIALDVATLGESWSYETADARALNATIAGVDRLTLLSLDPILARHGGPVSYDGVHLTPMVYPLISSALDARLAADLGDE